MPKKKKVDKGVGVVRDSDKTGGENLAHTRWNGGMGYLKAGKTY